MIDQTFKELNIISNNDGNLNIFTPQHEAIYHSAWIIYKKNIFFGIGPKLFREQCSSSISLEELRVIYKDQDVRPDTINNCSTHPHNTYIQLLLETGIIGALPVIIIFLFLFFSLIKHFYIFLFKRRYYLTDFKICLFDC